MTTPQGPHLRVGHAERDRAVEVLRDAAGDGRLTLEELDGRIGRAMAARTASDLAEVLADLVPGSALAALIDPGAPAASGGPGSSWEHPLELTARWDDVKRAGEWDVPPFLEVNPVAANVKLDFVDARVTSPVVDISLVGGAGDLVIVVPEGYGVDVTHLRNQLGSVKSTVPARPQPGRPQLVVRGQGRLGDVRVRHPNRLDTWQRERRLARGGGPLLKN